jgi:hypothetical protein
VVGINGWGAPQRDGALAVGDNRAGAVLGDLDAVHHERGGGVQVRGGHHVAVGVEEFDAHHKVAVAADVRAPHVRHGLVHLWDLDLGQRDSELERVAHGVRFAGGGLGA